MRTSSLGVLLCLLLAATCLLANPVQVTVTSHPFVVTIPNVGSGGVFGATIDGLTYELYCVDSQNYIKGIPTTYSANITLITTGGWDPALTRYGYVGDSGAPDWNFGIQESALTRYRIAAYLTSLYTRPVVDNIDKLIQRAIWRALDTQPPSGPAYDGNAADVVALYDAAHGYVVANPNAALWDNYRVVSGWYSGCTYAQTFITSVPEPGVGLLALVGALAGLLFARRRLSRS